MSVLDRFIDHMQEAGIQVLLCGVRPDFMNVIDSSGLVTSLGLGARVRVRGDGKFWTSTLEAVRFAYELVGRRRLRNLPAPRRKPQQEDGWYYLI